MKRSALKKNLDTLYNNYDQSYLSTDPLVFLHKYTEPEDVEVVGLVCASLAYGHVKMIQRNIQRVLDLMGEYPARYVQRFNAAKSAYQFSNISHRFNRGPDIALLLHFMKQMMQKEGSIGNFFQKGFNADSSNVGPALIDFVDRTLALDCTPVYKNATLPRNAGVRFFFPSPLRKSACKRLNLYLRWMIREDDGLDRGLWRFASPSQLVIPLDTHVARICKRMGLTGRKSPGWEMAVEITENLKKLDPRDPVKYDFAISRLGILDKCSRTPSPLQCASCEICQVCSAQKNRP